MWFHRSAHVADKLFGRNVSFPLQSTLMSGVNPGGVNRAEACGAGR